METSDKKFYGGCLFGICIFAILVIWIRSSNSEDEEKSQRYKELMAQISREPDAEKAIALFNEAY